MINKMRVLFFCFLFASCMETCIGQTARMPSAHEIFDFQIGDSLEYYFGHYGNSGYQLEIITNRVEYVHDSIVYTCEFLNNGNIGPSDSGVANFTIINPDSVFYYNWQIDRLAQDSITLSISQNDTIFNAYLHYSFAYLNGEGDPDTGQEAGKLFCKKGLGAIVEEETYTGIGLQEDYIRNLIYGHKANGVIFGNYYPFILTGISPNTATIHLTVSPNPTSSFCILQLPRNNVGYTGAVYNITGCEVMPLNINTRSSSFELNLSQLPQGLYFVKVTDEVGKLWTGKIVKD